MEKTIIPAQEAVKTILRDSLDSKKTKLDSLTSNINYNFDTYDSFLNWSEASEKIINSDHARHILYYGFQPLYDALVDNKIPDEFLRKKALQAFETLVKEGSDYITNYYIGEPNVEQVKTIAQNIAKNIESINYYFKKRNIDTNYIYPQTIGTFINKYINWLIHSEFPIPDTIICCACGPSEIAMALAGVLKCNLNFIRRSKRRENSDVVYINEHKESLMAMCKDKNVLVIEDYIVSGISISEVMRQCQEFEAKTLLGACVNGGTEYYEEHIKAIHSENKLHIFKLSDNE